MSRPPPFTPPSPSPGPSPAPGPASGPYQRFSALLAVPDFDRLLEREAVRFPRPVFALPLARARGLVLAKDHLWPRAYPAFDRACMDGFAIRSRDWEAGARIFALLGSARAGDLPGDIEGSQAPAFAAPVLPSSEAEAPCCRIATGAPVPKPFDAVLPQEWVEKLEPPLSAAEVVPATGKPDQSLRIHFRPVSAVTPNLHIHPEGTDFRAGEVAVAEGRRLGPVDLALLAAAGYGKAEVRMPPSIGLLSTGDELLEPGAPFRAGGVYRSNPLLLEALLRADGIEPGSVETAHARDDFEALVSALEDLFSRHPLVLTTGGVSVGDADLTRQAITALGFEVLAHGIAQKPGKPLLFARHPDGRLFFGLPGNPVAAAILLRRFVAPFLARQQALHAPPGRLPEPSLPRRVLLSEPLPPEEKLTRYLLVRVTPEGLRHGQVRNEGQGEEGPAPGPLYSPVPGKNSGDLAALSRSDGFIEVPPRAEAWEKLQAFPFFPF